MRDRADHRIPGGVQVRRNWRSLEYSFAVKIMRKEEMITPAVRGMNYLKPRREKFFFCPGRSFFFTEDTVRVLMQKAKENENDHEKAPCTCLGRTSDI